MAENIIAVFIPIVFFLILGLILVAYFYYRSRERQMLIEKGLDAKSIKEFFEKKKDPYWLLKLGIVIFFFGLGLGIGLILNDSTSKDYYVPLFLFTFFGLGAVIANLTAKKLEKPQQ
jgi:di/tricarboxylate transporter